MKKLRILLTLLFFTLPLFLSAQSVLNEDSLWEVKRAQLKNYTQINAYVADMGYKHKTIPVSDDLVHFFPGISGPTEATLLPSKNPTSWKIYDQGNPNRLAIYLTDTTSNWLGLVGGLVAQGVPFRITTSIDQAMKHKVMIIYPSLRSDQIGMKEMKKIRNHPSDGGALIAFNVTAPSMRPVFGFDSTDFSPERNELIFRILDIPETRFIRDKNEIVLRIGNPDNEQGMSSIGYIQTNYRPVAQFEDGSAAIIRNLFSTGASYAFGFDLGFLASVAHTDLLQAYRTYINDFEPSVDVCFRLIKSIYQLYEPMAFTLGSVPDGKYVPVLITHDIDTYISVDSMLYYADMEKRKGIKATYFIQSKYIKDGLDIAFLNDKYLPYMQALINMGMEVGSHSVSHTPFFGHLPIGSGIEKYPDYRPFFVNYTSTFNETLLGELRVSRYLLNTLLNNQTHSFRSGFLAVHENLYVALQETGYLYSSNVTANQVLTHMPFRPMYDFMFDEELKVYEIPVTIEDELPPEMDQRLDDAIDLTHKIASYGGVVNILIHPNILGHKFRFEEMYIDHFRNNAWFGTMNEFGQWWKTRSAISLDAENLGQYVKLTLTPTRQIEGLMLQMPESMQFISATPLIQNVRRVEGGYLLSSVEEKTELVFKY